MASARIDALAILHRQLGVFVGVELDLGPLASSLALFVRMGAICQRSQRRSYFHHCHAAVEQVAPPQAPSGREGTQGPAVGHGAQAPSGDAQQESSKLAV